MSTSRYSFHKPTTVPADSAPALREVRENGTPIGLINAVLDGYALRTLDGKRVDVVYHVGRPTAANLLRLKLDELAAR